LFNEAVKLYNPEKTNGKSFSQHIKDEIAVDAYNSCCDDFGNEEMHRPELLQHFQNFLSHFPDSDEAPLAKERVRVLTAMIQQDAREPALLKNPSEKEKIAEDIKALKDYRGDTGYGPSLGVVIEEGPAWEPGVYDPAKDLIYKGLKAVPQLIDALDDGRYAPGCVPAEPASEGPRGWLRLSPSATWRWRFWSASQSGHSSRHAPLGSLPKTRWGALRKRF
jgi:hypothetical protein